MILCVSPNPAVDRTYAVPGYGAGGVFRPSDYVAAAGGKGINVARAVHSLGAQATCAGFLGGHAGRQIAELVTAEGFASRWTWLPDGETRTCIIITDAEARRTTVINEAGPQVTAADWARLSDDVAAAREARVVAFSGSLPPGEASVAQFVTVLERLRGQGVAVWVDASGEPLRAAAGLPGLPIKINMHELAALLSVTLNTAPEVADAGATLHARTGAPVVVTMGRRGAVYVDASGRWYAQPPAVTVASAVGSGDSFLAGLLVALMGGESPAEALRQAAAAGTANALTLTGGSFTRAAFTDVLAGTTAGVV